jgi:hypothetical protein
MMHWNTDIYGVVAKYPICYLYGGESNTKNIRINSMIQAKDISMFTFYFHPKLEYKE